MKSQTVSLDINNPLYHELFRTPSKRGRDRKLDIVTAVVQSLSANGLHHTTFDSVGKLAKMERSHIVYYFKTHDEMIQAAVFFVALTAQSITASKVSAAKSPRQKLVAVIESAFDHVGAHSTHAPVLGLFYHLCTHNPSYRQIHVGFRRMGCERISAILELLYPKRNLSEERLAAIAKTVQVLIFGFLLEYISANPGWSPEHVKRLATQAVFTYLDAELGSSQRLH